MARVYDIGISLRPDMISRAVAKDAIKYIRRSHKEGKDPVTGKAWPLTDGGRRRLATPQKFLLKTSRAKKDSKGVQVLGWPDDDGLMEWIEREAKQGIRYFGYEGKIEKQINKFLRELNVFRPRAAE
jgi:hypothetical protein